MSYLLDTCILSKLRKIAKQPDIKLENWIKKHNENLYFISALTIGEIQSGISKLNLKKNEGAHKRLLLEDWLLEELIPRFHNRILSIDVEVVLAWGRLFGEKKQKGLIIPVVDSLIAATAIVHNLTLVTENISDFIETGARLFNPWLD
ncbi:PilT protein domain protein [Chlamydiales bacterium STE3]|nr:PilT protein domain protein [Chlamydiales bacterium STE3]